MKKSIDIDGSMVAEYWLLWGDTNYRVSDIQYRTDGTVRRVKVYYDIEQLRDGVSKWVYPNGENPKLTLKLSQRLSKTDSQVEGKKNALESPNLPERKV